MQNILGSFQTWPKVLPKFSAKFPYVLRKFLDKSFLFQNFRSLVPRGTYLGTKVPSDRKFRGQDKCSLSFGKFWKVLQNFHESFQ